MSNLAWQNARMTTNAMQVVTDQQLELGLGKPRACRSHSRPARRMHRAQWWFARMREAVDNVWDRTPTPSARPEQIWFSE